MSKSNVIQPAGLDLPATCVLVKRVRGVDGRNGYLGDVVLGHIYTATQSQWTQLVQHCEGEFVPARPEDIATIDAWEKPHVAPEGPAQPAATPAKAKK